MITRHNNIIYVSFKSLYIKMICFFKMSCIAK